MRRYDPRCHDSRRSSISRVVRLCLALGGQQASLDCSIRGSSSVWVVASALEVIFGHMGGNPEEVSLALVILQLSMTSLGLKRRVP